MFQILGKLPGPTFSESKLRRLGRKTCEARFRSALVSFSLEICIPIRTEMIVKSSRLVGILAVCFENGKRDARKIGRRFPFLVAQKENKCMTPYIHGWRRDGQLFLHMRLRADAVECADRFCCRGTRTNSQSRYLAVSSGPPCLQTRIWKMPAQNVDDRNFGKHLLCRARRVGP